MEKCSTFFQCKVTSTVQRLVLELDIAGISYPRNYSLEMYYMPSTYALKALSTQYQNSLVHHDQMIRGLENLPYKDRMREQGAFQPGEKKASGEPYSGLPIPEGGLQENWGGTFYKDM